MCSYHGYVWFNSRYDIVCVSDSIIGQRINGKYKYLYFNSTLNGTIYYNNKTNTYLYPYINCNGTHHEYQYIISNNPNNTNSSLSICNINEYVNKFIHWW